MCDVMRMCDVMKGREDVRFAERVVRVCGGLRGREVFLVGRGGREGMWWDVEVVRSVVG